MTLASAKKDERPTAWQGMRMELHPYKAMRWIWRSFALKEWINSDDSCKCLPRGR